jgi:hypothetical protein
MTRSKPDRHARLAIGGALASVVLSAGLIAFLWLRGPHDSVVTLAITAVVLVIALLSLWLNIRLGRRTRTRTRAQPATDAPGRQRQGAAWLSAAASFITAVATLLSSGATGYAVHGVQQPARTVYVTPGVTPASDSTDPPQAVASVSVPACARKAPVQVTAPHGQDGYKELWQGCVVVDSAGLTFGVDGPQKANGHVYDLAYQPDAGGWQAYANYFDRWTTSGRPGPAYCAAESNADDPEPVDARGTLAAAGQRYCMSASGSTGGPYQVVLQAYDVTGGKVRAAGWEWHAGN